MVRTGKNDREKKKKVKVWGSEMGDARSDIERVQTSLRPIISTPSVPRGDPPLLLDQPEQSEIPYPCYERAGSLLKKKTTPERNWFIVVLR
uniref:Uncharacterized protein n=1 Tax=Pristionchus pacificus TaxID=54126 RepID=A0A2A6B8R1_PRIPA|eukprot:PDM62243.1 hypothetical protein PRIPAC_51685 [Pristionchus pacificus]